MLFRTVIFCLTFIVLIFNSEPAILQCLKIISREVLPERIQKKLTHVVILEKICP